MAAFLAVAAAVLTVWVPSLEHQPVDVCRRFTLLATHHLDTVHFAVIFAESGGMTRHGVAPPDVALAWPGSQPAPSGVRLIWGHAPDQALAKLIRTVRFPVDSTQNISFTARAFLRPGSPRWGVRGHQISAQRHPLMFRSTHEFSSFAASQVLFGTTQFELAHFADTSPVLPFATACAAAGLAVSFWWPCNAPTPEPGLLASLPRLDALFFPGGDGGTLNWTFVQNMSREAKATHPNATIWVSAQELDAAGLDTFFAFIATPDVQAFLDGVVFGPHVRIPLAQFVARVPVPLRVRQYPDLCHVSDAQFALAALDTAWALTHDRQSVSSLPAFEASIVALRSNGSTPTVGVGAYSEGVSDDVNKAVWSALAEDASLSLDDLLSEYVHVHFGLSGAMESDGVALVRGLEQNLKGVALTNTAVPATLASAQAITVAINVSAADWRLQMYLFRAAYDAYELLRLQLETARMRAAVAVLQAAPDVGSDAALVEASGVLRAAAMDGPCAALRVQALELVALLNATVGAEVVCGQELLALSQIDAPLSDAVFAQSQMAALVALPTESARLAGIAALVRLLTDPSAGALFYDNVGDITASAKPHLDPGQGQDTDPSLYFTPGVGGQMADYSAPLSWSRCSFVYYDNPLVLRYTGLSARMNYSLALLFYSGGNGLRADFTPVNVAVTGADAREPIILVSNFTAPSPMSIVRLPIPPGLGDGGALAVTVGMSRGLGGNGRGVFLSQAWLFAEQ